MSNLRDGRGASRMIVYRALSPGDGVDRGSGQLRQIQRRLQKLKEAIRPDDNMFTFVELCRSMWRQNKERYLNMANSKFPLLRGGIAQFELEDLEAQKARARRHNY